MSALNLLSPDNQTIGQAPYIPSTLGQNVSAAFGDMMMRREGMLAPQLMEGHGFNERDRLIKERFGEDPTKLTGLIDALNADPVHMPAEMKTQLEDQHETALSTMITEGRKTDPERWSGIKTREEIRESIRETARFARTELEQTQARAGGVTAFTGGLVGGIGGAFTDPINLATLPLGAGAGMGILRAMAVEGLINAGVEAVQVPSVMKWQKELGYKYGIGEAAADVATAGVGGAALTGIIRGIGTGMRAIGSKSMEIMSRMSQSRKIPSEAREALKVQSRVAHIDESIPVERAVEREDIIVHRQAVQETQDSVNAYREPGLTVAREKFDIKEEPTEITVTAYHGTGKAIETFDTSVNDPLKKTAGTGAFFSSDPDIASTYARGERPQVYKSKITFKNPMIVDLKGKNWNMVDSSATIENPVDEVRRLVDHFPFNERGGSPISTDDIARLAREHGYDGAIIKNVVDRGPVISREKIGDRQSTIYVAFKPEQIETGFSSGVSDLVPEKNAFETMTRSSEAAAAPEVKTSFDADFARLVKENPDMEIVIDGQKLKLRDVLDNFKQDENVLKAIKTCAVG